jgi:hypothetical protein
MSRTLSEKRRDAVNVRYERERLIKQIADELAGEPLAPKTTDELRAILTGVVVRR